MPEPRSARSDPAIALVATLDTKGGEAVFLRDRCRGGGHAVRLIDVGTAGTSEVPLQPGDVPRAAVAEAAGRSLRDVASMRRDEAMATMGGGAAAVLRRWHEAGALAGVIGIGGHQGTTISGMAMRGLPLGVPRVLVSTVAPGDLRPVIGPSDIAVLFSVGDLLGGPNRITRPVLSRAAGMLLGMLEASRSSSNGRSAGAPDTSSRPAAPPAVAITALGNTHAAVMRVIEGLRRRGYEAVPFHASGTGGSAMESLVRRGEFHAVIDLTPHELLGEVLGDDIYAPVEPGRLTAAGAAAIPCVVAPGGLDYFVFGAEATVPARYRARATHHHNPYNTNVRATADELRQVGRVLAERLNAARGPAAFLYPRRGWSYIGRAGGPLWDPEANEALRDTVRRVLQATVRYAEVDAAINDPEFGDAVLAAGCEWLPQVGPPAARPVQAEGGVPC